MSREPVAGLDPAVRAGVAREVLHALRRACPGSRAELRGSLAAGTADAFSDVDVAWVVPAARFGECVDRAGEVLARVRPAASLRSDPEFADATGRRLLFAAFAGLPLFWRLDLEVSAAQSATAPTVPTVRHPWPPAASALANGVAAAKALHRGRPDTARALLERAFPRVGVLDHRSAGAAADLAALCAAAIAVDPAVAPTAAALLALPLP